MGRRFSKLWIFVGLFFLVGGCAGRQAMVGGPGSFSPVNLDAKIKAGSLAQKVEGFFMIFDASSSMGEKYMGESKLDRALTFAHRFNSTLPNIKLWAGLRTFGGAYFKNTTLLFQVGPYSKSQFGSALSQIRTARGYSPLEAGIEAGTKDLISTKGKIAVIIISDGKDMAAAPLKAAKAMKATYGDRLCIYTVVVGDDKAGSALLKAIAKIGGCGFSINADDSLSSAGMAKFVENVFFEKRAVPVVEKDSDGDGVVDSLDICPNTPRGAKVDIRGCPLDSDGDGVYDYMDKCPDTPRAVLVNEVGCPFDTDHDGVPDYMDQCPDTPLGVHIDNKGCPYDSDGDGVYDYQDKCPGTPKGATVNEMGCWVLKGLNFDTAKWDIKPKYYPLLDQVVGILKKNPNMRLEIQGHTDNIGSASYNQELSQKRAEAVREYLMKAGISPSRLKAVGYGFRKPVASNDTPQGRAKNRRVELLPIY